MEGRPTGVSEELVAHFARFLDLQAGLRDVHTSEQRSPAAESSSLSQDDAATSPLQIGHFVSYCLMQSVDMATSMRAMVRREDGTLEVPVVALYPLLRAQIESASMAAWVLGPPDRRTRILRRLRAGHDELTHDAAFVRSSIVGKPASEKSSVLRMNAQRNRSHKQHLRDVADAHGVDPKEYENSRPPWETIVRDAGESLGIENCKLVMMWRLASGFTHPSLRRGAIGLAYSLAATDGDIVRGVMSPRADWMLTIIAISYRATDAALKQWHSAKATPEAELSI